MAGLILGPPPCPLASCSCSRSISSLALPFWMGFREAAWASHRSTAPVPNRCAPRPADLGRACYHLAPSARARCHGIDLLEQPRHERPSLGREGLPWGRRRVKDQGLPTPRPSAYLRITVGDGGRGPPHDQGARRLEDAQHGAALRASLAGASAPGDRAIGHSSCSSNG